MDIHIWKVATNQVQYHFTDDEGSNRGTDTSNPGTDSLTPTLLQLTQYWLLCSYKFNRGSTTGMKYMIHDMLIWTHVEIGAIDNQSSSPWLTFDEAH